MSSYVFPSARKARAFCVELEGLGVITRRWEAFVYVERFLDWRRARAEFERWAASSEFDRVLDLHGGREASVPVPFSGGGVEVLPRVEHGPTYRPVGRGKR